ncbi:MAG: phage tail protein [Synergistaceae bacterium]|nr:phage tail protein [Synergistaceae bacterium]
MIGSFGDIVFEVSSESVKTFQDLQFQYKANYAQHDVHGSVGLLEYTGRTPTTCSLKMRFDSALNVEPMDEIVALYVMMRDGVAAYLILDGDIQGDYGLWVIESFTEEWKVTNNTGKMIVAESSIQLKEYIEGGDGNGA